MQLLRRSPINLRPFLLVPKTFNPKGMGIFLATYLRKYQMTEETHYLQKANFFANWLQEHILPNYAGACWGYHFDWPNRGFYVPVGTPTIVNTAFIALALLDFYYVVQEYNILFDKSLKSKFSNSFEIARSSCNFLLNDLNIIRPANDELCFSYTLLDQRYVHNANLIGAWLLSEVYAITSEPSLAEYALYAARYTARRQQADGSWLYGEGIHDGWVDNYLDESILIIKKILNKDINYLEISKNANQTFLKRFTVSKYVQNIEKLLK